VPESGDVDLLVTTVAAHRGRPIKVIACELEEEAPSGLWLQTAGTDYIVHPAGVAAEHRRVVICHELAHMLLQHGPRDGDIDTSGIAPSIAPAVAARFFARHGYEDGAETEAESLATQLATELERRAAASRAAAVLTRDNISTRLRGSKEWSSCWLGPQLSTACFSRRHMRGRSGGQPSPSAWWVLQ
jgi:hypothetical protein